MPIAWHANTQYSLRDVVVPPARNGHVYRPTKAGTSAATEPAWSTTAGATFDDGSVTWAESGWTRPVAWRAGHQYRSTEIALPVIRNGHRYTAQNTGVSGDHEPSWP